MSVQRHTVDQPMTLQAFVAQVLVGAKPRRIQQLLRFRAVAVNGAIVTRAGHPLAVGDQVAIHFGPAIATKDRLPAGIRILFEDEHLLVVDKPPGLLAIATEKERERTAYALLTDHVRERTRDDEARVFIVHRLDQGTSGLMIFARSEEVKRQLQEQWKTVEKKYLAVVEGCPRPDHGTLRSRLQENRAFRVYSTPGEEGEEAVTHYRTLRKSGRFALLEVTLETGRKNQIRVHLSDLGHPVVGDGKYGAHSNPISRLALHAAHLVFTHPVRQERLTFTSPLPPKMRALIEGAPPQGSSPRRRDA